MAAEHVIYEKIDTSRLAPVEGYKVGYGRIQTIETAQAIKDNSLSFRAIDIVDFTSSEALKMSKKIGNLFKRVSYAYRLPIDGVYLAYFNDIVKNPIAHEISHLAMVKRFRIDVLENANVHILPVKHQEQLKVDICVISPRPNIPYTLFEYAHIQLAPDYPSYLDYHNLRSHIINSGNLSIENMHMVYEMVNSKPDGRAKADFLDFLSSTV